MTASNLRRLGVLTVLVGIMLLAVVLLAGSYIEVGITDAVEAARITATASRISGVPQAVADDAAALAHELYGNSREKYEEFARQLVGNYLEAQDKDFVIVFNSGGWGWKSVDASPGWQSIIDGVREELAAEDYTAVMFNYRRTSENMRGLAKEFVEAANGYPAKARDLAYQVRFITTHAPEVRVILAGESNGTVISDTAMDLLRDEPRVYSIQTGPPFWHHPMTMDRTLVLRDNGTRPDTFTQGNIPVMLWASIRSFLGLSPPDEAAGTVMNMLRAPGHDYSWDYPVVYTEIVSFLRENFSR
ncbi:MAG: hypothetical protein ABID87_07630 [Chloroflexota bacterium]